MSEDNWDLNALVRSCSSTTSAFSAASNKSNQDHHHVAIVNENVNNLETTPFDCLADLTFENDDPFCFSDLVHQQQPDYNNNNNLKDSLIPFNLSTSSTGLDHKPTNILPGFGPFSAPIIHPQLAPPLPPPPPSATNALPLSLLFDNNPQPSNQRRQLHHHLHQPLRSAQSQGSRSSRKKKSSQKKLVMQVAAENLCSDVWAWRKYGQKPIKGSPYPRNYYRCSSSKGCTARKQVERSNSDPNMFTVSYTGDHTHPRPIHRNSLAGSVRNKFPTSTNSKIESDEKAINGLSPTTPLSTASMEANNIESLKANDEADMEVDDGVEIEFSGDGADDEIEKEEDINLIPNMTLNEDLIKGLQQMSGGGSVAAVAGGRPDFGDNFTNRLGSSGGAAGNKSCLF